MSFTEKLPAKQKKTTEEYKKALLKIYKMISLDYDHQDILFYIAGELQE